MAPRWLRSIWSLFVAGLLAGCGYQFTVGGAGPTIGGRSDSERVGLTRGTAPRVAIQNLDNLSFETNLALKYTEYLRREFATGSGARLVAPSEAADFLLRGKIESVSMPSLAFTQTDTFESRAIVTVKLTARDLRTRSRKIVWEQRATGASEYFLTNDLQFNSVLQRRALEQAGAQIAGDLAARFLLYLETAATQKSTVKRLPPAADDLPPLTAPPKASQPDGEPRP